MDFDTLINKFWNDYIQLNPQANKILNMFKEAGNNPENDHIAIRTFNKPGINLKAMTHYFESFGYTACGDYHFDIKKLDAIHLECKDTLKPKIFISELITENFSEKLNNILNPIFTNIANKSVEELFTHRRTWDISLEKYNDLYQESEYAAWLYTFGFCANHFTVLINSLESHSEILALNSWLKESGYRLNASNGEVKGHPSLGLEQSSTMAPEVVVDFEEGPHKIPGCYYEFAKRYNKPGKGHLYQGFVTASADKIFESTNKS